MFYLVTQNLPIDAKLCQNSCAKRYKRISLYNFAGSNFVEHSIKNQISREKFKMIDTKMRKNMKIKVIIFGGSQRKTVVGWVTEGEEKWRSWSQTPPPKRGKFTNVLN